MRKHNPVFPEELVEILKCLHPGEPSKSHLQHRVQCGIIMALSSTKFVLQAAAFSHPGSLAAAIPSNTAEQHVRCYPAARHGQQAGSHGFSLPTNLSMLSSTTDSADLVAWDCLNHLLAVAGQAMGKGDRTLSL